MRSGLQDVARLQAALVTWHVARFPDAEMVHVALKTCEEAGEVARAVNGVIGKNMATGGGDVPGEAADVLITLFVLLGRWFPEVDLLDEVRRKLAILVDPSSGHRAAALPEPPLTEAQPKVVDLMAALEESLAAVKSGRATTTGDRP
jgi:hypothetical protein